MIAPRAGTLNALAAATHLALVTEPSFLALQGIEELLRTRDLVETHNARLVLAGVIVNRVERTVEHQYPAAEQLLASPPAEHPSVVIVSHTTTVPQRHHRNRPLLL